VPTTEILLATGDRIEVDGDLSTVEATIIAAARGSIMALAWLTEAGDGHEVAVNPEHVVTLRAGS
jgi:hypothetical protein